MPRKSRRSLAASRRWKREKQDELHDSADPYSQRKANDDPLITVSRLNHLGTFNRQELNTCAAPRTSATDNAASRKRKPDDTEGKPYIKKPPNAFMLFSAEQRQNVAAELHTTDAAKVNVGLGQKWKMLSEQEQAPFFDQAHRERRAHEAKYPGWSANDNFGRKTKRRKANKIPIPTNHHFAFPVAPANQQPVMTCSHATAPMSVNNQALSNRALSNRALSNQAYHRQNNQALSNQALSNQAYHRQNNQKPLTSCRDRHHQRPLLPALPPEAFLNPACENQAPIKVLPVETFTIPVVSTFQDLSNQAPPCNRYEVFLNMDSEELSSDFWTSHQLE